jgi:hypothetical protein
MAGTALAAAILVVLATASPQDASLLDAEAALLSGDPQRALKILAGAGSTPRRLRLEVDAHVALQDREALTLLDALARHPEWTSHANHQRLQLEESAARQDRVRLGTILFALTLGLLILAGARELLVVRIETIVAGIVSATSLLLLSALSEALMTVAGVVVVAGLALVHAGTAAVRRTAAPPRIRALIAASMLLGFAGVLWAVAAQIGLGGLFGVLAKAAHG